MLCCSLSRCSVHQLSRDVHGAHDRGVAGTPAEAAVQRVADGVIGRLWIGVEERLGGEDHGGSAIAALDGAGGNERRLDRVQVFKIAQFPRS